MHTGQRRKINADTTRKLYRPDTLATSHSSRLHLSLSFSRTEVRQQIRNLIDCVYALADSPRPRPRPEALVEPEPVPVLEPDPGAGLWASSTATQQTRSTPSRTPSSAARMWTARVGPASRYVSASKEKVVIKS